MKLWPHLMALHRVTQFPTPCRDEQFARSLKTRHVQLIAIGGTIGVGLFMGSARAIELAGPGLLLNYIIVGAVIFFIMRALGELLVRKPVAGALPALAEEHLGAFAGFATAWSYWFMWVVVGMSEMTAIGLYSHYWFPQVPQWLPALGVLGLLFASNMLSVKVFGELEFWFALIKVATIVTLIMTGVVVAGFDVGPLGGTARLSNLWTQGGVLPHGMVGLLFTLQIVAFAYSGVELVAMTAAEAEAPDVTIPRAINSVTFRILFFYCGSLVAILALIPWHELSSSISPFVVTFERVGLPGASSIVNFVAITAAASSCNSGLYSTGRLLFFLARRGQAPSRFGTLNSGQVPAPGISASAATMLIGVAVNAIVPDKAFVWVTSLTLIGTLWTWFIIMLAHVKFRAAVRAGRAAPAQFVMPGAPYMNWLVMAFLLAVTVMLGFDEDTRVALYVAPVWFAVVGGAFFWWKRRSKLQPRHP